MGNYLCEWAGLDLDFTLFPDKSQQLKFLQHYLEEAKKHSSVEDIESLYKEVNVFVLASHLLWGLWALVQMQRSSIDFDFLGYSNKRFRQYFKHKNEIKYFE